MNTYDFTLKFAMPSGMDNEQVEAQLFDFGCDDALVGLGQKGRLGLHFTREADTAEAAVYTAVQSVCQALPMARLIEVSPDLVGVSDIAEIFSFSRQNMRKLLQNNLDTFPLPFHEGRSPLWHLADVLAWFQEYQSKPVAALLYELAHVSRKINVMREFKRLEAA